MSKRFSADLAALLAEFSEQHRGVRLGRMFGWPAGYVGRRLFACVMNDGLIVRLPPHLESRELRGAGRRFLRNGKPIKSWVLYRPRDIEARRLAPLLELAVRHAAETQSPLHPRPGRTERS